MDPKESVFLQERQGIINRYQLIEQIKLLIDRCQDSHGVYVDLDVGYVLGKCYLLQRGQPTEYLGTGKISFEETL